MSGDDEDKVTCVTGDANGQQEHETLARGGLIELTPESLLEFAKAARRTKEVFDERIRAHMTKERAERIRFLRIDQGYSWRALASETHADWGADATWEPVSNQLAGMALCEAAAAMFSEDGRETPWN